MENKADALTYLQVWRLLQHLAYHKRHVLSHQRWFIVFYWMLSQGASIHEIKEKWDYRYSPKYDGDWAKTYISPGVDLLLDIYGEHLRINDHDRALSIEDFESVLYELNETGLFWVTEERLMNTHEYMKEAYQKEKLEQVLIDSINPNNPTIMKIDS